jgi:hypothetical protein
MTAAIANTPKAERIKLAFPLEAFEFAFECAFEFEFWPCGPNRADGRASQGE